MTNPRGRHTSQLGRFLSLHMRTFSSSTPDFTFVTAAQVLHKSIMKSRQNFSAHNLQAKECGGPQHQPKPHVRPRN
ncbi:hypothetical protein H0G86_000870 [Trichoderma simmonsii]|uniref:Uncharacterized protein n=1 Tax=Trichoderma simmonsii TaxID=1491479 RepID=A0A8G0P8P5_9HYPO|nr:hypothetical protein H0G86_000870 [Trichoderma simmonsii]